MKKTANNSAMQVDNLSNDGKSDAQSHASSSAQEESPEQPLPSVADEEEYLLVVLDRLGGAETFAVAALVVLLVRHGKTDSYPGKSRLAQPNPPENVESEAEPLDPPTLPTTLRNCTCPERRSFIRDTRCLLCHSSVV